MTAHPGLPWVLVRKGKPVVRFPDHEGAARFFDSLRFNTAVRIADAALFGPEGEAWYCEGSREGTWHRNDARRKHDIDAGQAL